MNSDCCLCGLVARRDAFEEGQQVELRYACPACGTFTMALGAQSQCDNISDRNRQLVSIAARRASDQGRPLIVTPDLLRSPQAQGFNKSSVSQRVDNLIRILGDATYGVGERVLLSSNQWPRITAMGSGDLWQIFGVLMEQNKLDHGGQLSGEGEDYCVRAALTPSGWAHYESLARAGTGKRIFVAMKFSVPRLEEAYRLGIAPAIQDAGLEPVRVDAVEHNEKICDIVTVELQRCRAVVADVTDHSHCAYYEAGFAMGLGLPVIWACHKDQERELKFDTRQYSYILWETPEELRRSLSRRLQATVRV